MSYYGDIALGSTIDIGFTSRRFTTGAPFTLAGSPSIAAYVDNSTTEITAGITLSVDFDGRTGLNNIRVVATSGNGFATATNVKLVITAGTVDSVSVVGEVVASFSIENRSAIRPATAGRTIAVEADGMAHADVKEWLGVAPLALASQQVQAVVPNTQKVDVETIKTQAVSAAGAVTVGAFVGQATAAIGVNASGHVSRVVLTDTVTTYTGNTPQTGDSFIRLGAPAGASVSADVAAVKVDTGNLVTRITSTLFSGITSLAQWLGLMAGKQTGDATARTEIRATGAGSGTFLETSDSLEALRDRGDAAWITATGFSTHSAADVWAVATRTITAFGFTVTIGTDGVSAASVSAAAANKIADHGRRRTQANVFASTDGDALAKGSLYGFIQQAQRSDVLAGVMTIKNTDGTTLGTLTFTADAAANPVIGVS